MLRTFGRPRSRLTVQRARSGGERQERPAPSAQPRLQSAHGLAGTRSVWRFGSNRISHLASEAHSRLPNTLHVSGRNRRKANIQSWSTSPAPWPRAGCSVHRHACDRVPGSSNTLRLSANDLAWASFRPSRPITLHNLTPDTSQRLWAGRDHSSVLTALRVRRDLDRPSGLRSASRRFRYLRM